MASWSVLVMHVVACLALGGCSTFLPPTSHALIMEDGFGSPTKTPIGYGIRVLGQRSLCLAATLWVWLGKEEEVAMACFGSGLLLFFVAL